MLIAAQSSVFFSPLARLAAIGLFLCAFFVHIWVGHLHGVCFDFSEAEANDSGVTACACAAHAIAEALASAPSAAPSEDEAPSCPHHCMADDDLSALQPAFSESFVSLFPAFDCFFTPFAMTFAAPVSGDMYVRPVPWDSLPERRVLNSVPIPLQSMTFRL